ncbi:MAG TPA: acyl-CoA dehydrogenase family protein [Pyrinomonadaceae bacterium]|jgi:alkylation response protein AidB-like acyl-CoA dehydrogenase|nr:acyl-CoA dehydrogenase family protein [Pyrinomonadaceae bacterium]
MITTDSKNDTYGLLELNEKQQELINRVCVLARENFAPRAAGYDVSATFPFEDFDDLFRAGLHAPVVPEDHGGLGLGPYAGDVFTLWMMTKEIARVDLSLARCWEGHVNSLVLLDGMSSEEQKARWFKGVVERGEKWVAWSGEPQARKPGEAVRFGTRIEKVDGGYIIEGNKAFATSAGGAQWAILLVNTAGPGGVRHANASSLDTQLMMACNLSDPSIEIDTSWWDPIGMRATASHLVHFRRTFIPESDVMGYPGQYLKEGWQTCFIPHYAATFLGAAEAAYDYAMEYITSQNKIDDPYVQHHIGQMSVNVETAHLWLRHVARLWETGRYLEAQLAGSRARHVVEHLAESTVKDSIRACGARCLIRPSTLERVYRDLSFYVRHDNDDHILATIGKSVLGLTHDPSFYKP